MNSAPERDIPLRDGDSLSDELARVGRDGETVRRLQRDDFDRDVWCLMGIPVDAIGVPRAVAEIEAAVRDARRLSFVTPNVNWLVRAARDPQARRQIIDADLSLVDGAPLVVAARILGMPIRERAAGSDVFEALRRRPSFGGRKIGAFFFGGREGAGERAVARLNDENGGVAGVGALNPGYGDVAAMSTEPVLATVNAANPDFIVVALGAAKGQDWIDCNKDRLAAPVLAHLGAVVDFTAGGIRRAPSHVRRRGFEWIWRVKEEPSLWRRYLRDGFGFTKLLLTSFMPQLLRGAAPAHGSSDESVARATAYQNGTMWGVRLEGELMRGALTPVRTVFREVAAKDGDVVLDLTGVQRFDQSFLGLILMLEKHIFGRGAKIYISGASDRQMRLFALNNMNYPACRPLEPATSPAEAPEKAAI